MCQITDVVSVGHSGGCRETTANGEKNVVRLYGRREIVAGVHLGWAVLLYNGKSALPGQIWATPAPACFPQPQKRIDNASKAIRFAASTLQFGRKAWPRDVWSRVEP